MPETAVFDHYEVMTRDDGSLFELGRGAMGITYKAFDTSLRIPVALKVINATYLHSEVARQRFIREARAAAQLRNRHVASVFHLGTEGDTWFYAMEFIDGETLESLIKRQGPLNPVLALTITGHVARALTAAAQHKLVHRDIKPANLMLVKEDDELVAKVIDFGLAKATVVAEGEDAATLSLGGFVGTPHFASPEQLEERELDSRSDIYSLGVTLWYMLAGQTPFAGSMAQVMSQHLSKAPPFERLTNLHPAAVEVLRTMLAKEPPDRYQTPGDLRKAVEVALEQLTRSGASTVSDVSAEAPKPPEDVAHLLEGSPADSAMGNFETNTMIANRYQVAQSCGETNAGRVFRAYDKEGKKEVRLLVLRPEMINDSVALTALEREIDKLVTVKHRNLLTVYGFETVDRGSFVVFEWTNGFSVLELLKARRELHANEALKLLEQAAAGADEALRLGLNNLEFGLHHLHIHFSQPVEKDKLLRSHVENWPAFELKLYPLGATHDFTASQTWAGAQTIVNSGAGRSSSSSSGGADVRPQYVQALGAVIYEILGGTLSPLVLRGAGSPTARYTPLTTLSEEGNEVLRRALDPARSFASATEFSMALAGLKGLQIHPPREPRSSAPGSVVSSSRVPTGTSVARGQKSTVADFPAPAHKSAPVGLIVGLAVVVLAGAAGGGYYFLHQSSETPTKLTDNPVVPEPTPKVLVAQNLEPVSTPIVSTPIVSTTKLSTPVADVAQLQSAISAAQELEDKGRYSEALSAWLAVAKNYPQSPVGTNHLETFIGNLRARPQPLTPQEFQSMRQMLYDAAQLDVLAAMMLLGDRLRDDEPEAAFYWYKVAADKKGHAPAMTLVGLLLSNRVLPNTPDMPSAIKYFQAAADKDDASGKMALGDCYQFGRGVPPDQAKALALFREAVDAGNLRAMVRLGDCYRKGSLLGKKDPAEAFRLFSKAYEEGSYEGAGNLGVLYLLGETPEKKPDEKKAVELWKEGTDKQNALCTRLYAQALESGFGLAKNQPDPARARSMYQRAAEGGDGQAIDWCTKHLVPFTPKVGIMFPGS